MPPNDPIEAGPWHPGHQLGEKSLARVHRRPPLHHPEGIAQTPFQIDTKVLRRNRIEITGDSQKAALGSRTAVIQFVECNFPKLEMIEHNFIFLLFQWYHGKD
jgi:hypothetical protein